MLRGGNEASTHGVLRVSAEPNYQHSSKPIYTKAASCGRKHIVKWNQLTHINNVYLLQAHSQGRNGRIRAVGIPEACPRYCHIRSAESVDCDWTQQEVVYDR